MHEGVNLCTIIGSEPSKYAIKLATQFLSIENLKLYIIARKSYPEEF